MSMNTNPVDADQQQSSTFRLTAEAHSWGSVAFRDLPRGASLSIEVATTGPIEILLLDDPGYKAFPKHVSPLLQAETADNYGFSLVVPNSGDYYLVADNRDGGEQRVLVVRVTATAPGARSMTSDQYRDAANQMLSMVEDALRKIFVMDEINLRTEPCGNARCFAEGEDIVVCTEYAMVLLLTVSDRKAASPAMMFNIFQRLAEKMHARFATSELTVAEMDELATALMVMLGYRSHAETQAKYFQDENHVRAIRQHVDADDPHPLDPERAVRIEAWSKDPDLLSRWQHVLVPVFQTEVLERLRLTPPGWLDVKRLEPELVRRGQTVQ